MLFLLWFSTTVCEGRLCERLKIYSGKYLFNKSKFYLEQFLTFIFTFQTGSLHMTSCWLCSKVVNNISRNFFSLQSYVYSP
jgi:hypothetical protein